MEKHFLKRKAGRSEGRKSPVMKSHRQLRREPAGASLPADSPRGLWGGPPLPADQARAEQGPHPPPSLDVDPGCLVPCVTCSPGLDLKVGMDVGRLFGVCGACAGCWLSPQPGEIRDPLCGGAVAQVHRPVWASAPWQQNSPLDTGFPDSGLPPNSPSGADFLKRHRRVSIKCWCFFTWSSDMSSRASATPTSHTPPAQGRVS